MDRFDPNTDEGRAVIARVQRRAPEPASVLDLLRVARWEIQEAIDKQADTFHASACAQRAESLIARAIRRVTAPPAAADPGGPSC